MKRSFVIIFFFLQIDIGFSQQFSFNGAATYNGGECYTLCPDYTWTVGSMWKLIQIDLTQPLTAQFSLSFGNKDANGADGIAFVLQQVGTNALGGAGVGIGYQNMNTSFIVEFDTYQNSPWDPSEDHIAIQKNGDVSHLTANNLAVPAILPNIEDTAFHPVKIIWDPVYDSLFVYFDCVLKLSLHYDIVQNIFSGNPIVWWGFTSATGSLSNTHIVCFVDTLQAEAGDDTISCGPVQLNGTVTGLQPLTYSWFPSAGLSNPNILNPVANPDSTTTYTLSVTDACGLVATDDMILTVYPQIISSAGPDLSICKAQQSASLNASGGYTYAWSPATGLSNANIANPVATPASTTTYTVTVSDMSGCTGTDAATVTVNPVPTFTYTADSVLCYSGNSGAINILVSGGTTPYTYTWTPNVSTGPIANNIPAGTYQIAISDINGCDTATTITVGEPPQLTLSTSGNITICNGQSTTISAIATGGVGSYTFTWDNGLGIGSNFSVNPTTTTTYIVSVTDGNTCSVTNSLTVMVSPPISVNVISNPASMCYGDTAVLTAIPNGGNGIYTYIWGQGIGISTQSITVVPVTTTMYPVTVTDNCGSPQGEDSVEVIICPLPTVQFTSDALSGCEPLVVTFADSSAPAISTWLWDFGDIQSGSDNYSTKQNPTHTYINAGTYTVTLTVTTTNGCIGSYTRQNMIIVFPSPDASFSMHPEVGSTQNPEITFIDLSTNASTWSWNFGEISSSNNTSNTQNPQHSYESAGIYTVTLVIESPYGCLDSTSNEIWIKQYLAIFFPNAFTPNGDSKNDGFRSEGDGVDLNNYQLYIYDRYGELIFKTNDFYEYWNGKVMGSDKMAEVAVYSWVAFVKDINGVSYTFNGRVTLIK